ncbi:MAG TPA: glycosyltransferase [candidate division Zixibacteria bacterium]|nr:glycosyltransferase [candidate division Zixibacteria bacterium]
MESSPHILHLGWSESPHVVRWLAPLQERGYEVRLLSYGGGPVGGTPTVCVRRRALGKLGYALALPEALRSARVAPPDLIHAHYAAGFGLWGARMKKALGVPLVVSCLGTDIVQTAHTPVLGAVVRGALEAADALIAPSRFLAEQIAALNAKFAAKTRVIYFGMDLTSTDALCDDRQQSSGPVRVLFFKHHRAEYGPEVALRAFALARQRRPHMTLTLGGRGPLTGSLKRLAGELNVVEGVTFPGYIQPEHALGFIAEHDILLMPTQVAESFGVAALEAAAVAVPTVGSNVGGIPEVVRDRQTGLLLDRSDTQGFADALVALAEEPERRMAYGAAARAMVEREFDWKEKVDSLAALYRELLR